MGLRLSQLRPCDLCLASIFDTKRDRMFVVTIEEHRLNKNQLKAVGSLVAGGATVPEAESLHPQPITTITNTVVAHIRSDRDATTIKDIIESHKRRHNNASN